MCIHQTLQCYFKVYFLTKHVGVITHGRQKNYIYTNLGARISKLSYRTDVIRYSDEMREITRIKRSLAKWREHQFT